MSLCTMLASNAGVWSCSQHWALEFDSQGVGWAHKAWVPPQAHHYLVPLVPSMKSNTATIFTWNSARCSNRDSLIHKDPSKFQPTEHQVWSWTWKTNSQRDFETLCCSSSPRNWCGALQKESKEKTYLVSRQSRKCCITEVQSTGNVPLDYMRYHASNHLLGQICNNIKQHYSHYFFNSYFS